jgi:hypothetical protein
MVTRWALIAAGVLAGCRIGFDSISAADAPDPDAATTLHIIVTGWGAVTGPGIACAADCTVPLAAPVPLTATPGETWTFETYDAPCGLDPSCTAMPGDTIRATFTPAKIVANRAFVSSQPALIGPMGRAGLDMQCSTLAAAAGMTGTFIALVSTSTQDAVDRLSGSRGWVRLDGLPILDLPTDLGLFTGPRGIAYDETMQPHHADYVLTASTPQGRFIANQSCSDWSSTATPSSGGLSDGAMNFLAAMSGSACSGRLFCFEIGKSVPVALAPPKFPVGRYAFLATSSPLAGIAANDAKCQSDAMSAGLPGSYQAALPTTTQSVVERIGPLDGAWRRPDGASLTRTGLGAGNFDTALAQTADGTPISSFVILGAPRPIDRATPAGSCNDWSADTAVMIAGGGFTMSPLSGHYTTPCNALPMVCVQTQ